MGKKALDQEKIEVKDRRTGSSTLVGQDEVLDKVRDLLKVD